MGLISKREVTQTSFEKNKFSAIATSQQGRRVYSAGNKVVDTALKHEKRVIKNATSHAKVQHNRKLPWRL